jgi:SAM-dependent methyltransferase
MTSTTSRLYGSADRILELFEHRIPIENLYGDGGSRLYDNILRRERVDVDAFLRAADGRPGPVLELACGNGRTTIPVLEQGYEVVGLDASEHMLQRLTDKLREPDHRQYADKLTTVEGDMSQFSFDRKFGLILLGTSTVWMLTESQRASLFASVREHLTEDGRFLLTLQEFPWLAEDSAPFERMSCYTAHDGVAPVFCTHLEYVDPQQKIRQTNIFSQRVHEGAVTRSVIYTAQTNLLPPSVLADEVERAGLRVAARTEFGVQQQVKRPDERRWLLLEVAR